MTGSEQLVDELNKSRCICYYPSSGTDLSNLDFFGSGRKLWAERTGEALAGAEITVSAADPDPDLFIHTDVNFYQEFAAGRDFEPDDCGMHGRFEVLDFRELQTIKDPNRISDNYEFSGKCFAYKLRLWDSPKVRTLIYCLCENEALVADILLAHKIRVPFVWSRNWNGGQTYGTWLVNVLQQLQTIKVYTDWLCVPGRRGEPRNRAVEAKYPELMVQAQVELVRNNDLHWIDQGAHGWVEEFDVRSF
ncbi:MAG TPA: hypothetical protein PLM07_07095 [Candidatus Rifleibacterium sp.]|nr:hypothetical protein [Candidatus Rifleibacterium sp.]HPT45649.1 hypothetical protein [Candidatus Rifleibacterium sp.]